MRKSLFFLLFLGLFSLISLTVNSQESKYENLSVIVDFHCPNGIKLLETGLRDVEGIKSFVVDLDSKTIDFKYDPQTISKTGIVEEIEKSGNIQNFQTEIKRLKKLMANISHMALCH